MIPYYENRWDKFSIYTSETLTCPRHLHPEFEIIYAVQGSSQVLLDTRTEMLSPGDFLLLFPNTTHGYQTEPGPANAYILSISKAAQAGEYANTLLGYHPASPIVRREDLSGEVVHCLNTLLSLVQGQEDHALYRAYIQVVLAHVLPKMDLIPNRENSHGDIANRVLSFICEHYRLPLSLDVLSREFGISKSNLSRIFSSYVHTSFNDYLNNLRIDHACILLSTTDKTITQISYECGFTSQRTFNRAFSEACGTSPRDYRKEHPAPGRQVKTINEKPIKSEVTG